MTTTPTGLDLTGLRTAPSQTWGAVRLVPLLREEPITDLRLHPKLYGDELSVVQVAPRTAYIAFVPHSFVATWRNDGTPAAAYGTQLRDPDVIKVPDHIPVRFRRRMARRVDRRRLRFLPLHLALEGYLALHFGGPALAWEAWSRRAVAQGLSPRCEASYTGADIHGLEDALRVFEIHPGQCGMVLYLADALAGTLVVPHPDDYRALHATLLQDLYGELLYLYAHTTGPVQELADGIDATRVRSVADLRAELARSQAAWAAFHDSSMAGALFGEAAFTFEPVYRMGRFRLWRFLPVFDPHTENHIGESITDTDGHLAYLKTFRLSAAQTRRGHLLSRLAASNWQLDATATNLGITRAELIRRLDRAGFGHLLREDILAASRNRARRPSSR